MTKQKFRALFKHYQETKELKEGCRIDQGVFLSPEFSTPKSERNMYAIWLSLPDAKIVTLKW